MVKVFLNEKLIGESDSTVQIEGNHYFPIEAINIEFLKSSNLQTTCPWKGVASYYHLYFDGIELKDKVWYYPNPSPAAEAIKDKIAFYQREGIRVVED